MSKQDTKPLWPIFVVLIIFFVILAVVTGSPKAMVLPLSDFLYNSIAKPRQPEPELGISIPTTISNGFYNNTNCGISMLFPVNWIVTKYSDETLNKIENVLLTASPPSQSLSTLEFSMLDISNPSVYPKKSLDEVVEFEIDYIMTGTSDTIETITNTKISGFPARTVVYNEDFGTLHNRIMKLWVVASGKAYQIAYDSPREEYTQHLDEIQRIIASIKLFHPTKCEVKST